MDLAHTTNATGDFYHSAAAAGADTKEHAKRHQRGALSFSDHHHPVITSCQGKSNPEHPTWGLWTAEVSTDKRTQNEAVLGDGGEPGTGEHQPFKGVLKKICCNFWKGGILIFRGSIKSLSVMFICYLDLSMSFHVHITLQNLRMLWFCCAMSDACLNSIIEFILSSWRLCISCCFDTTHPCLFEILPSNVLWRKKRYLYLQSAGEILTKQAPERRASFSLPHYLLFFSTASFPHLWLWLRNKKKKMKD